MDSGRESTVTDASRSAVLPAECEPRQSVGSASHQKIWVDLDNSPHVPFFAPIIEELARRGHSVLLTTRDCFQVCDLANLFGLNHQPIGRHYGSNMILKLAGLGYRGLQMAPLILREKPDLALSHGSRAQLLLATVLRIPTVTIADYEFATLWALIRPSWLIAPEVIPDTAFKCNNHRILRYPGIKEDVYVPKFKPDPSIKAHLGLREEDLVVTLRPPASEAHYHNPKSDVLFDAAVDFLAHKPNVRIVLLPRNVRQAISVRGQWSDLFASGKVIIPGHAIDGLNLIWYSDLVISGGGTMNREAAALGVPVYSIFRGKIGAVDRYLVEKGRLILLEAVEDVRAKIVLTRRHCPAKPEHVNEVTLQAIVSHVVAILERTLQAHKDH